MPLAGILVQYTGWSSVFYVYGMIFSSHLALEKKWGKVSNHKYNPKVWEEGWSTHLGSYPTMSLYPLVFWNSGKQGMVIFGNPSLMSPSSPILFWFFSGTNWQLKPSFGIPDYESEYGCVLMLCINTLETRGEKLWGNLDRKNIHKGQIRLLRNTIPQTVELFRLSNLA